MNKFALGILLVLGIAFLLITLSLSSSWMQPKGSMINPIVLSQPPLLKQAPHSPSISPSAHPDINETSLKGDMNIMASKAMANECSRWNSSVRTQGGATVHTLTKVKNTPSIFVYENSDIVSASILRESQWESQLITHALSALAEARILTASNSSLAPPLFLDIGANLGIFTISIAAEGSEWSQKVVAFEPLPQNLALLRSSICSNPSLESRIILHPVGLGDQADVCYIGAEPHNIGNGFILGCSNATALGITQSEEESRMSKDARYRGTLMILKLGELLAREQRLMVVKMDTEGFEIKVLKGAEGLFGPDNPRILFLIFELNTRQQRQTGNHALDLINQLQELGYLISMRGFSHNDISYLDGNDQQQLRELETHGDHTWTVDLYATHQRFFEMKGQTAKMAKTFKELS